MTKLKDYKMFIDGEWVDSESKKTFETLNPENNEPWATVPEASSKDVDKAVTAAQKAFDGEWPKLLRNILAETNNYNVNTNKPSFVSESTLKGKNEKIKKAAKIINQANQFIIIVGAGIKYNAKYKEVVKLAELLNIPIVTAAGHGDSIPFNHKLNAGQMGPRGNPVASRVVKEADVILAIGTRLGFNSSFFIGI